MLRLSVELYSRAKSWPGHGRHPGGEQYRNCEGTQKGNSGQCACKLVCSIGMNNPDAALRLPYAHACIRTQAMLHPVKLRGIAEALAQCSCASCSRKSLQKYLWRHPAAACTSWGPTLQRPKDWGQQQLV